MTIRLVSALLVVCSLAFSAQKPVDPVRTGSKGLAVKGYDPVAYFTLSKPTVGSPEFEYQWHGATWRFANADNLEKFKADPEKYAPQYGGYCAYAVSIGKTASISPKKWIVKDGKLYLNHRFAQGKFKKDVEGNIAMANENWPNIPKNPLP